MSRTVRSSARPCSRLAHGASAVVVVAEEEGEVKLNRAGVNKSVRPRADWDGNGHFRVGSTRMMLVQAEDFVHLAYISPLAQASPSLS